jgi:signal transduction histidine kinase/CheY-like chemotaxis protein
MLNLLRLDMILLALLAALAVLVVRVGRLGSGRLNFRLLGLVASIWALTGLAAEWFAERESARMAHVLRGYAMVYAAELVRLGLLDIDNQTAPDDPTYLRLIAAQRGWLADNSLVADVYTYLRLPDGSFALGVDSETDYDRDGAFAGEREARTAIGEPYPFEEDIAAAFAGSSVFNAVPTTDRWGTWVSAYVPVGAGERTAVVGVDYRAASWVQVQRTARLVPVLFGALLISVVATWTAREAALRQRYEAEATSRAREALLANVSHEMRTPLNGILGLAELLAESPLTPEQAEWLATVRESAGVLLQLINEVLDLSKLRSSEFEVRTAPFDLRRELDGILRVLGPEAQRKRLVLHLLWPQGVGDAVRGDKYRVRQVITNLMANAVKFTDAGSVSLVVTRPDRERPDLLSVAVRDTGIGLDPSEAEQLFLPFEQGDNRSTRQYGGTGLGLTISRMLVQRMGGTIEVAGRPGLGATFTVTLPLAATDEPLPRPTIIAPRDVATEARVLVVEDNAVNRKLLGLQLARLGVAFDMAENGLQAIELGAARRYTMILMDCQMPVMDGLEATRRIRGLSGGSADAPIVALTASAMPGDRESCIAAGMSDFLAKPVDLDAIAAVVHRWAAAA